MKKSIILLAALALSIAAKAQGDVSQYSHQYEKLYKAYVKEPENVANNYALAAFYADTANPMRNYATAMKYICTAEEQFVTILEDRDKYKEVKRLLKRNINIQLLRETKLSIRIKAREFLDKEETISDETLDSYADAFKNDQGALRMVEYRRMGNRYQQVCATNTLEAYRNFIASYPSTAESEEAERKMAQLAEETIANASRETEVDSLLDRQWKLKNGLKMRILAAFIDSGGHFTTEIYRQCAKRQTKRIWPVKGEGGEGKQYCRPMKKSAGKDEGIKFILGVDQGKEGIMYEAGITEPGPNYMHFPVDYRAGYDMEFFRGLISEQMVIHRRGGKSVIAWEKVYERNEPLDCRNYARAAYRYFNWHFDELERMINGEEEPKVITKAEETKRKQRHVVSRGIKV